LPNAGYAAANADAFAAPQRLLTAIGGQTQPAAFADEVFSGGDVQLGLRLFLRVAAQVTVGRAMQADVSLLAKPMDGDAGGGQAEALRK